MTNELEKKFFDTFGIEQSNMCKYAKYGYEGTEGTWYFCAKNQKECWTYPSDTGCKDKMTSYPEITDRRLLNLICIANEYLDYPTSTNIKNIQARTLRILLRAEKFYDKNHYGSNRQYKKLVKRVRKLFKEK